MVKDAPEDARVFMVKEEREIDGEAYMIDKPNPAIYRQGQVLT